jgi:hypothetical protein
VWKELKNPNKPGLILHDSRGFTNRANEAASKTVSKVATEDEIQLVSEFLKTRLQATDRNERLHVIWLVHNAFSGECRLIAIVGIAMKWAGTD